MTKVFRIHPAIGVARLGDADRDTHFIGPEFPGVPANYDAEKNSFFPFKDKGKIRPQAARFRIWEYDRSDEGVLHPIREVTLDSEDIVDIRWSVHLANRKAAFFRFEGQKGADDDFDGRPLRNADVSGDDRELQLVIDPGEVSVSGREAASAALANQSPTTRESIPDLGELRTDSSGRLIVIGGSGRTHRGVDMADYVNNDGWLDDAGDGPVAATVVVRDREGERTVAAEGAWVVVGPPDFAPAIGNVVSLLDTMWDLAVRDDVPLPTMDAYRDGGSCARLSLQRNDWDAERRSFRTYRPSFQKEILPLLQRALLATEVHAPSPARVFHRTIDTQWALLQDDEAARTAVFTKLRDPNGNDIDPFLMPKGLGDRYVDDRETPPDDERRKDPRRFFSLTQYQYALMRRWADGEFEADYAEPAEEGPRFVAVPISPEGLDHAALENCVGGPFFPGIEVSWLVRKPGAYREAFRLSRGAKVGPVEVGPGFLTQQMAVPWQADFRDCKRETFVDPISGVSTSAMWWAAQRPDDVRPEEDPGAQVPWIRAPHFTAGDGEPARYEEMRRNWSKQGFVVPSDDGFQVERERNPE